MDYRLAAGGGAPFAKDVHRACLLSPEGRVTRAIGSISRRCHWTTHFKSIERGSVRGVLVPVPTVPTRLLCDSWFMRARLVLPLPSRGVQVIAQARIDTALFLPPETTGKPGRGRPRTYGQRLTAEAIAALPSHEMTLTLHGKAQKLRVRSAVALARFLKARPVRAAWCEFYDDKKQAWAKPRLLLATETDLSATAIVELYARRWGIEPLFHNLKRWWGISNLWQQSRTALETWMQIRATAWTLAQLLALTVDEDFPLREVAPWRKGHPLTAGLVAQWLRIDKPEPVFDSRRF